MAPQPLSRVRPSALVTASPDAIVRRPKLAPLIGNIADAMKLSGEYFTDRPTRGIAEFELRQRALF
jgi:hypothetical protein